MFAAACMTMLKMNQWVKRRKEQKNPGRPGAVAAVRLDAVDTAAQPAACSSRLGQEQAVHMSCASFAGIVVSLFCVLTDFLLSLMDFLSNTLELKQEYDETNSAIMGVQSNDVIACVSLRPGVTDAFMQLHKPHKQTVMPWWVYCASYLAAGIFLFASCLLAHACINPKESIWHCFRRWIALLFDTKEQMTRIQGALCTYVAFCDVISEAIVLAELSDDTVKRPVCLLRSVSKRAPIFF